MKLALTIVATVLLLSTIPVSILWVWHTSLSIQFLATVLILLVSGIITLGAALSQDGIKEEPKSPIRWH